ncbi:uncharacterized protein LOC122873373 isoform X2 [Siniperca chuatsi]|uniref:uncharacterized protein LOC122873373 isoform X2 n=1 Tax=Siniperca chuatsi TaxID=119488 RepID=UPI001CE1B60D|nr:uncharacterized protein LOC122873373 isoform X2 [Siniperca chuatsi]
MLGFCLTDTTDTYLSFGSLRSGSVWVCEDRVTEYEMRTTPSELKLLASVLGTCNAPKKSEDRTGLSLGECALKWPLHHSETCPGTVSPIVLGDDLCQMTGRGQQRLKKQGQQRHLTLQDYTLRCTGNHADPFPCRTTCGSAGAGFFYHFHQKAPQEICQHIHTDLGIVVPVKQAAGCQVRCIYKRSLLAAQVCRYFPETDVLDSLTLFCHACCLTGV